MTLIELVVVLLVMSILATMAIPRFLDSLSASRVEGAAKRIVADLNLMRSRAMMTARADMESVTFDIDAETYTMTDAPGLDHADQEYVVSLGAAPYGVDISTVAFKNESGGINESTIQFDMYGKAWCQQATLSPLAGASIVVVSGTQTATVTIDPVTGIASIE